MLVGGLGRHVYALSRELARAGHDVVVLSRQPTGTDATTHPTTDEQVDGLRVLRVAEDPPHLEFGERDLVAWVLGLGHALVRAALTRLDGWRADVVHAHDWLVCHAAITLADAFDVPLVATIHATEAGRHSGWLSTPLSRQIHSTEWWLVHRADRVVTCSAAMRDEVATLFDLDPDSITVIRNGITARQWHVTKKQVNKARARWAPKDQRLLLYFGRLEYEKGVQDLITALPLICREHPTTRLVIAGVGGQRDLLEEHASTQRVRNNVIFAGHLPDDDLATLLAAADAVVLPSRYEPFGLVALEAAAAGAPLVASTAGGLREVVIDGKTGVSFTPGDITGLAEAVSRVLADPASAARRARAARARLTAEFDWATIAAQTAAVYAGTPAGGPREFGRPTIPTGNVFDR